MASDVSKCSAGPRWGPAFAVRGGLALAVALALSPVAAAARTSPSYVAAQSEVAAWQRGHASLWIDADGRLRPEARQLIDLVRATKIDGLEPKAYQLGKLEGAVRGALAGKPRDLAKADMLLSQTLVAWARDMRSFRPGEMRFADLAAIPGIPSTGLILQAAAKAPSLAQFLDTMPWMHPAYGALRATLLTTQELRRMQLLRINMMRARALPGTLQSGRYVLVDAADARLDMVEDGVVRDSMRVVVGRTDNATPMLAGVIRYAIINPYWNVPPDLAATRLAPHIVTEGLGWLVKNRYEVLSDWTDKAKVVDPKKIDWAAVVAGRMPDLRMRQLPGADNSMGRVKFMFPNDMGIYLHDTDDKSLFAEPARQRSGGCIRLQSAPKLARWLFGKPLATASAKPEQRVAVPVPVPVYVTYLTAEPVNGTIAYREDIYGRDGMASAAMTVAR